MALLILQLVVSLFGISAIVAETFDKDPNQPTKTWKKVTRGFGIGSLLIGGLVLIIGHQQGKQKDVEARQDLEHQLGRHKELLSESKKTQDKLEQQVSKADQLAQTQEELNETQKLALASQSKLLNAQGRGLHQLTLLSLDRTLSGIEVSYKPTVEEWKAVVDLYRKIVPTNGEPSYFESPIIATRAGAYWRIDFDEISLEAGRKWFPPVFTDDPRNRGFEEIIQKASVPLRITWGNGAETFLEPMRGDYPSGLKLSPDLFVFTLRPPVLELNLASLHANSIITLRSRKRLSELTFHSLDPAVKLNQTVPLTWSDAYPNTTEYMRSLKIRERVHPLVSGPHRLKLSFRTLAQ